MKTWMHINYKEYRNIKRRICYMNVFIYVDIGETYI